MSTNIYVPLNISSGGGGGNITSVNGDTGPAVILEAVDIDVATGYVAVAGTVVSGDTIQAALEKIDGTAQDAQSDATQALSDISDTNDRIDNLTTSDIPEGSNLYFTTQRVFDVLETTTTFSLANNQSSPADITGLVFDGSTSGFEFFATVVIAADDNKYEVFTLTGVNRVTDWELYVTSTGTDVSGVVFSITSSGQVQYTTPNYPGFASATLKYKAVLPVAAVAANVISVNGRDGVVVLTKADVGLSSVDNLSLQSHLDDATDAHDASAISYDNTTSGLIAVEVQAAIDELSANSTSFPLKAPTGVLSDEPSYGFAGGDNDTGMYSTGDGNISFQANGFHRLSIDQNETTVTGDLDITGSVSAANYPPTGNANTPAYFDNSGDLQDLPNYSVNTFGAVASNLTYAPNGGTGGYNIHETYFSLDPLANTPNESVNVYNINYNIDPNSSGFTLGTSGSLGNILNIGFYHQGTSDIGTPAYINMNSDIGNGTDPVTMNGFSYVYGFLNIDDNVTVSGQIQGYGFQPNLAENSIMNNSITAFYDAANVQTAVGGYTSFQVGPQIEEIKNNTNYTGINLNANVDTFTGNGSYNGLSISGNLGTFDTGGYNGVNINPTITSVNYAAGLNVTMDNVTVYPGTKSSLVFQDLTLEFIAFGDNNGYSLEYTSGGTAGSEVVTILGQAVSVQIENGVSTATQVKAALDGNIGFATNLIATITGVGSNPQVTAGPTNFTGGTFPGNKKAAYLDGDVEITGSLTFGGALSIGQLNAFYSSNPADGGGNPQVMHGLITSMTALNGTTVANGDAIGVNTAMLITLQDNSVTTSGAFGLGFSALALPCVVETHSGASLDFMSAATYAVNLSGTSTGGTIDTIKLCRSVVVPNGITTVNNVRGFEFDQPFGSISPLTHGFYTAEDVENYFKKSLVVGELTEVATNSSVGLEISSSTKAMLLSRLTTTERNALTAVNGMVIYNTTTDKFQGYEAGSWVDLV